MKIQELFVEKLYGKYNFSWTFDDRVNILAGRNGSYKSTLLSIIAHICRAEHVDNDLNRVRIRFSDDLVATFQKMSLNSTLDTPQKKEDFLMKIQQTHPEMNIPENDYDKIKIILAHFHASKGETRIEEEAFRDLIK